MEASILDGNGWHVYNFNLGPCFKDVTLWQRIGSVALKMHNFPQSRHAFEQVEKH